MARNRPLIAVAVVVGVLLLVIAALYFAEPAKSLPSFFPGHSAAGGSEATHHHVKHGIAALVVGLGCFVIAWFASGPRREAPAAGG
jgi:uncharacterized membrane protein HdeD (DUF308 family)